MIQLPSLLLCVLSLLWMTSCSGDDSSTGPGSSSKSQEFSQPCTGDDDCKEGFFCAKGGSAPGLCTMACEDDGDCSTRLGKGAHCSSEVCVVLCIANAPSQSTGTCPEGAVCNQLNHNCTLPDPNKDKIWNCTESQGVCSCTLDAESKSDKHSCSFGQSYQESCCGIGGAERDTATWTSCVCQKYSAIPEGSSCYDRQIQAGQEWGVEVNSCP